MLIGMIFNNRLIIGVQNYIKNNGKNYIFFKICIVMSTIALQNLNLKFNLCMEKKQIVLWGSGGA